MLRKAFLQAPFLGHLTVLDLRISEVAQSHPYSARFMFSCQEDVSHPVPKALSFQQMMVLGRDKKRSCMHAR